MSTTSADPSFCPPASRRYVLLAAILASSMGFIDGSVISIATPAIRADLGASLADAQWISNAYLLLLSSLLLVGGAAGDRFGLRNVFALGIGLFVAASLVSAAAPTPMFLIIARAVQGFGASIMVPASLAIIAKAYPREDRGRAIGIWASASSLTTILGPVLGGLLLTWLGDWSWRLVFAVNLPLGGISLGFLLLRVPADPPDRSRRPDLIGGALATVALLLVALGLTGDPDNPSLFRTAALTGGGIVLLGAFLFWESRATAPMLPLRLFRSPSFSGAQGLTFALYFALAAISFFLPMTLIAGWGISPAEVSLALLPLGIALTLLSPWAGRLADEWGAGPPIALGSVIVAAAFLGLGLLLPLRSVWLGVLPMMVLFGIGMGLVVSPLSTAVMTSVPDSDTGVSSGINNAVARVAGLLAVAIMGVVAARVFEATLGPRAELPLFFGQKPETGLAPDLEAIRVSATDAAFQVICWTTAALALLSAAIAWFTLERKPLSPVQPPSSEPDRAA